MRTVKHKWLSLGAVLTALALLAPVAPDVLALWGDHDHRHGSGYSGGWVHRSADHARHDASQLEQADPVQRTECALCTGRSRLDVSVVRAPESAAHQDVGRTFAAATSRPAAIRAFGPSQPRAPPIV